MPMARATPRFLYHSLPTRHLILKDILEDIPVPDTVCELIPCVQYPTHRKSLLVPAKPQRVAEYKKGLQGQRIYSTHAKSIALTAGGRNKGKHTGL